MDTETLIKTMDLQPHVEGGYFRRTYQSEQMTTIDADEQRHLLTSIYYLLTDTSPIGCFHRNRSSIIHYFHLGGVLEYTLISPQGEIQKVILGSDILQNQQLQLIVPGGYWKASQLINGEFALISEAVSPGFDYADMQIALNSQLEALCPEKMDEIKHLIKTD